jgi:hypothetical protein
VMLTIVLIVTTYMFFRSYSEERDRAKGLQTQKDAEHAAATKAIDESEKLKGLIGAANTETLDDATKAFTNAMQTHGEGIPESKQSYRALVDHLVDKLHKFEDANTSLTAHVEELNVKLKANEEAAAAEVAKLTQQQNDTAADLAKERKVFGEKRDEITGEKNLLAAGFETTRKEFEQLQQKSGNQISSLSTDLSRTEQLLEAVRTKAETDQKRIEVADGQVTRVNQRTRAVWINVGAADGLRLQTSFVVVAPEDGNPIKSKPKGTIEVVSLAGPHQAEARIVKDDLSNPIMPGDNVFSVVWDAGKPEHFALAGKMDIDSDGESDHQRIRNLVALNGGIIDAEVTADGQRTGQMSINTKYLVLGDRPDAEKSKDRDAYGIIYGEAQKLGVKTLNVDEFLDYMGYKDEQRTVTLGRDARESDFRPRLPGDRQRVLPGSATPKDLRKPRGAAKAASY